MDIIPFPEIILSVVVIFLLLKLNDDTEKWTYVYRLSEYSETSSIKTKWTIIVRAKNKFKGYDKALKIASEIPDYTKFKQPYLKFLFGKKGSDPKIGFLEEE